jgi:hypothetical protein
MAPEYWRNPVELVQPGTNKYHAQRLEHTVKGRDCSPGLGTWDEVAATPPTCPTCLSTICH